MTAQTLNECFGRKIWTGTTSPRLGSKDSSRICISPIPSTRRVFPCSTSDIVSLLSRILRQRLPLMPVSCSPHASPKQYVTCSLPRRIKYAFADDTLLDLFLNRIGKPSLYLPTAMMLWGLLSLLTGVVTNYTGAVLCRFFLGFVEAAFLYVCCAHAPWTKTCLT